MGVIHVSVRGHAVAFFPGQQERFDFPAQEPLTVLAMLEKLGVDPLLVMLVNVNGEKKPKDFIIRPGDEVLLLGPPSGG